MSPQTGAPSLGDLVDLKNISTRRSIDTADGRWIEPLTIGRGITFTDHERLLVDQGDALVIAVNPPQVDQADPTLSRAALDALAAEEIDGYDPDQYATKADVADAINAARNKETH